MTNKTMWTPQNARGIGQHHPTATVFDILRHIRSTSPSTCYWCKKKKKTVAVLVQHIHSYWVAQEDPHFDACNYEASYEGEETGWVTGVDCHEFEAGCYCADAGKCEVCVERMTDMADYMRKGEMK